MDQTEVFRGVFPAASLKANVCRTVANPDVVFRGVFPAASLKGAGRHAERIGDIDVFRGVFPAASLKGVLGGLGVP